MNKDIFQAFNTNSFVCGVGPDGLITIGDRMDEIVRNEDDLASGKELYREAVLRGVFKIALSEGEIVDKKKLKGSIWEYKVVYGGTILKVWATEDGSKVLPPIKSEEELERILKEIREGKESKGEIWMIEWIWEEKPAEKIVNLIKQGWKVLVMDNISKSGNNYDGGDYDEWREYYYSEGKYIREYGTSAVFRRCPACGWYTNEENHCHPSDMIVSEEEVREVIEGALKEIESPNDIDVDLQWREITLKPKWAYE